MSERILKMCVAARIVFWHFSRPCPRARRVPSYGRSVIPRSLNESLALAILSPNLARDPNFIPAHWMREYTRIVRASSL